MSAETKPRAIGELILWTGTHSGLSLIFPGHGHQPEDMTAAGMAEFGSWRFAIAEEWLNRHPRIKWCENLDGGCDSNGDWHVHWSAVKPSAGADYAKWTVVTPIAPWEPGQ